MDDRPSKAPISVRTMMVIIPLAMLLVASCIMNVRQYQLIQREHHRELAAEAARAREEAERIEVQRKKKAEWAASDARVQQLYREINTLSQINERMVADPLPKPASPRQDLGADSAGYAP